MNIENMSNKEFEILINGLKVLKDRYFYEEVFEEIEKYSFSDSQKAQLYRLKAECLYQNKQIPSKIRFPEALEILNQLEDDAELLSLKGAIYKRKYLLQKDIKDLFEAIKYYEKASNYKLEHQDDSKIYDDEQGYGTVNTIYLYKLLLNDLSSNLDDGTKKYYKDKIEKLKTDALAHIEKYKELFSSNIYLNPTIAELYFADLNYEKAKEYLDLSVIKNKEKERLSSIEKSQYLSDQLKDTIVEAQKKETKISRAKLTTIEQFIALYKLDNQDKTDEESIAFLKDIFKGFVSDELKSKDILLKNIITSSYYEKIGLALSGGGFRAALFHIGVLARLAEIDLLRKVQVISTVSGGSIVGMMYYIMLRELLSNNDNESLDKEDYIKLVKTLEERFKEGIQEHNIRMEAILGKEKSITKDLGRLYQEVFYDKAVDGKAPKLMSDLFINPFGSYQENKNFNPHLHNKELKNYVPILIINSTLLNNGHNWRFTATGMGESPYMYDSTTDKNTIHSFQRYKWFSKELEKFPIADAVASSSCVPGLFEPLEIGAAFKDPDENIKLVDGGVYDNQGLASLIDEQCKVIICSDSSGQLSDSDEPSSARVSVIQRSNDILMERVRDEKYSQLKAFFSSRVISNFCIVHLKQCFKVKELPTNEDKKASKRCEDFYASKYDLDVQERLSKVRTDLDSFNDIEVYSLANSGYTITKKWMDQIKKEQKLWAKFDLDSSYDKWDFLKINNVEKSRVLDVLSLSNRLAFKVHSYAFYFLVSVVAFLIIYLFDISIVFLIFLAAFSYVSYRIFKKYKSRLLRFILKPMAKINLWFFNKKFLEEGEV